MNAVKKERVAFTLASLCIAGSSIRIFKSGKLKIYLKLIQKWTCLLNYGNKKNKKTPPSCLTLHHNAKIPRKKIILYMTFLHWQRLYYNFFFHLLLLAVAVVWAFVRKWTKSNGKTKCVATNKTKQKIYKYGIGDKNVITNLW